MSPIGEYLPGTLSCTRDLAFSPGGVLYGISEVTEDNNPVEAPSTGEVAPAVPAPFVHLVRFDTATGAITDLGRIGTSEAELIHGGGITFDATGALYVSMVVGDVDCQGTGYCLYRVDPTNPASATFLGAGPTKTALFGLTSSCGLAMLTIEATVSGTSAEIEEVLTFEGGDQLDVVSAGPPATWTPVGAVSSGEVHTVQSIDYGSDGTVWALGARAPNGAIGFAELSTLDPATGAQTLGPNVTIEGDISAFVVGLAVAAPKCPEVVVIQPNFTG